MNEKNTTGNRLLVVGAGGHAKVVIEAAREAGWTPVLALDPRFPGQVLGVPVLGSDDDFPKFWQNKMADAAVIAIGDNRLRQKLAARIRSFGCPTFPIIHPRSMISSSARIGEGVVVMAGAVVNADALIERDCIINTSAIVEHDCIVEEGAHLAPRSVLGGNCRVGSLTLFGIGSSARPGVTIGARSIVGAGSGVVSDIPADSFVGGIPARALRSKAR